VVLNIYNHLAPNLKKEYNYTSSGPFIGRTLPFSSHTEHFIHIPSKLYEVTVKVKVKTIPLQAWTGPKGSRSLRLPDFKKIGT
jgi:hypothetical protein